MASGHKGRAPRTFREVIDLWPSVADFARSCGFRDETVRAWIQRGNIPVEQWDDITETARRLGLPHVSLDTLMGAMRVAKLERDERRRREAAGLSPSGTRPDADREEATGIVSSSLMVT